MTFLLSNLFYSYSNSQPGQSEEKKGDRLPVVAGTFYPANKNELLNLVSQFFDEAPLISKTQPFAVIVPHAGYIFSGPVAAASYKQIDRNKKFDHVFLIGSSHTQYFEGVSAYTRGGFITPLGKVKVDTLSTWLANHYTIIKDDPSPHSKEHSLEVQLPFLQYWLKKPFSIVPLIIGGESTDIPRKLAEALSSYFNERNLFIISTDFSHYPGYADAVRSDKMMSDAICSNSAEKFLAARRDDENKSIPGLATSLCGWTSVLTLLDITQSHKELAFRNVLYRNSGDSQYGEKDKVVGYNAICVVKQSENYENDFSLTDSDKIQLLQMARESITNYIRKGDIHAVTVNPIPSGLQFKAGVFVTVNVNGSLRGCIGNIQSDQPLYKLTQSMAVAAATRDYRFMPVKRNELNRMEIEISVLTPMKKINSIDEIIMGKHGIYIKKGDQSGTFLPQVATETRWTKEEFLGHCARDKARIGWEGWKDADLYTYEALVFGDVKEGNHDK